jgi:hypothetical protein
MAYMRDSRRDPQLGHSLQIDGSSDTVEQDPFSDVGINAQIVADISRIGSAWLEWNAEPGEGTFDDKIVETLVSTLDAHANAVLKAVTRETQLPEYMKHLRRVGSLLIENAQRNSVLKDPYSTHPPLSSESIREEVDLALVRLRHQRPGMLGNSKLKPANAKRTVQSRADIANATAEMARREEARQWHEWRNQIINRIETQFEARYRHWQAEAIERVLRAANVTEPERRNPAGVSKWEDVEIEFLSDERVQIWMRDESRTLNYAELGFMDKRSEKPNQPWIMLRTLAELGGTLEDSAVARKKWSAVEKHIQRIRAVLCNHFGLSDDPIPFVRGVGFRTRFKIRCGASFET